MEKGTKVIALIDKGYELNNRVYDKKKSAPTIRTFQGGGLQPKVIKSEPQIKNNSGSTWKRYMGGVNTLNPGPTESRTR